VLGQKPVGLETPLPPEERPKSDAGEAAPVGSRAASSPPEPPAPAASDLPPIAAKADDLEAIKKAVDDAASVGGGLWLSYLFVLFYLAVAAGAVTHEDLFFERAVKLPFLTGIELPLIAFFGLAPILFVIVHAYTLVHLVMLKRYHQALHDPARGVADAARESLQWQLPSNIFIQFLAGPQKVREGAFGRLLRAIAWITLVIAPVLLLLLLQIQFLPFHSLFVTWIQRIALLVDLALVWWLWRKILSGREIDGGCRLAARLWRPLGLALSLGVLLFSVTVVTFPGESQEELLPSWPILPVMDEWGKPATEADVRGNPRTGSLQDWVVNAKRVSLHDWLFDATPDETTRRRLPFSSTLVLPSVNIYEGLGIDDPEKAKWHDFVFRVRGRDLRGAILDFAILPKVDFEGADLRRVLLFGAQLQGASLNHARLQGASLDLAQLQGASLVLAQLQGALLHQTQLQGALLFGAQLQGASITGARLQGAQLDAANLQGASLEGAQLQGASLDGTQLQGALLDNAVLQAIDLAEAYLWRTDVAPSTMAAIRMSGGDKAWLPLWRQDIYQPDQPWDNKAYQALRTMIESLPAETELRDPALKSIRSLAA
jgi:uncharacterized protein YjbI with pentapeptide repeats